MDLQAAVVTVREMMPWRKVLYTELRTLALELAKLRVNQSLISSNNDPEKNSESERTWAEEMRLRVEGETDQLLAQGDVLEAEMDRFSDAHSLIMKHAVPGRLNESDIGALSVAAISRPLTEDDPHLVDRFYDEALLALAKLENARPFDDLLTWAQEELKGKELALVELVCESGGRLALAQLAKNKRIGWKFPWDGSYNNIQNRINKKLEQNNKSPKKTRLPYIFRRDKNCAVIDRFE
jgi:hypothetical protein